MELLMGHLYFIIFYTEFSSAMLDYQTVFFLHGFDFGIGHSGRE